SMIILRMIVILRSCLLLCHRMESSLLFFFFFLSSRRRHTRSKRDWSSDVCSSDLQPGPRTVLYFRGLADLVRQAHLRRCYKGLRSEERRVGKERRSRGRMRNKRKRKLQREGSEEHRQRDYDKRSSRREHNGVQNRR